MHSAQINCDACTMHSKWILPHLIQKCNYFCFVLLRSHGIDPDAPTVAIDDVANLDDFNDFPAFPHIGDDNANDFSNLTNDSGFICNSQDMICPCCLQELDNI